MDSNLFNSLTEGDFGNGVLLCQSLLEGDFWVRRQDCYTIYRGGDTIDNIDYDSIVVVADMAGDFEVTDSLGHVSGSDIFYAVRRISGTGRQELGTLSIVRLRVAD